MFIFSVSTMKVFRYAQHRGVVRIFIDVAFQEENQDGSHLPKVNQLIYISFGLSKRRFAILVSTSVGKILDD